MAYEKNDWTPSASGPVMATPTKFNHFEQGIYDNSVQADKVPQLRVDVDGLTLAERVENGQRASLQVRGFSCPKLNTVYDYVDSNNVLHCKVGRVEMGELSYEQVGSNPIYRVSLPSNIKKAYVNDMFCSNYANGMTTDYTGWVNATDKTIGFLSTYEFIIIKDTTISNSTNLKNSLKGVYLYYEYATEQTYSVLDNNVLDTVGVTTNLLKPTRANTTYNGVTITNNGDGTYTLNTPSGACTNSFVLELGDYQTYDGTYKLLGWSNQGASANDSRIVLQSKGESPNISCGENGLVCTPIKGEQYRVAIYLVKGLTYNNVVVKPMLTTNLSATYNDFVPFTGTTGKLNSDVAEIQAHSVFKELGRNSTSTPNSIVVPNLASYTEFLIVLLYNDRVFSSSVVPASLFFNQAEHITSYYENVAYGRKTGTNSVETHLNASGSSGGYVSVLYGK